MFCELNLALPPVGAGAGLAEVVCVAMGDMVRAVRMMRVSFVREMMSRCDRLFIRGPAPPAARCDLKRLLWR